MTDLTPLIERLENAEDGYVPFSVRNEFAQVFRGMGIEEFPDDAERTDDGLKIGVLTTALHSLDAAIALVERSLEYPSHVFWASGKCEAPEGMFFGTLHRRVHDVVGSYTKRLAGANAATAPLALCIALLKALQNKESAA